jgi:endonuclease YncB( thermonuclease family)
MTPAIILCTVAFVVDADTIRCRDGQTIRLAGISALERSGRCNSAPDCSKMPYARAKATVERIALGRTYRFQIYGTSGRRIVADNRELRCAIIRSGAAVTWWRYARRYRLEACHAR